MDPKLKLVKAFETPPNTSGSEGHKVSVPNAQILRTKALPVENVTDSTRNLLDGMLEIMYQERGIGLAAQQVGLLQQLIVIDIDYWARKQRQEDPNNPDILGAKSVHGDQPLYIVNPRIQAISPNLKPYTEGCLSFPGLFVDVNRPDEITISYLDYHGKKQTLRAFGLLAVCVQHEIDHLAGVTINHHLKGSTHTNHLVELFEARS